MTVIKKLDRIRRNFLCKDNCENRKLHLIRWSELIKPKNAAGLGLHLGNMEIKNWALLAKWWWRNGEEKRHFGERL